MTHVGSARRRAARAVTGLTTAQAMSIAAGLVTAPIMARTLGPDGRGLLAALQAPVGVLPYVGQLGLGAYAAREAARGVRPARLVGSLGIPLLVVGTLIALTSPWSAKALAGDKDLIVPYLVVGLALAPVVLIVDLGTSLTMGLSQWRRLVAVRMLTPLSLMVAVVTLAAFGALTVRSAAVVVLASGLSALLVIGLPLVRFGRPQVDPRTIREGLGFGLRAWPGTLASIANLRLDQLIMIPLLSSRQLGLYAVAVTISGLGGTAASQVVTIAYPRIAARGAHLTAQVVRLALVLAGLSQLLVALATLVVFVPIFGAGFADARVLIWVLAFGGLFQVGASTLGQALAASGRPAAASIGEMGALVVTAAGLALLLGPLEALGAASVSIAAYATNFILLVLLARRQLGTAASEYVPGPADVRLAAAMVGSVWRR